MSGVHVIEAKSWTLFVLWRNEKIKNRVEQKQSKIVQKAEEKENEINEKKTMSFHVLRRTDSYNGIDALRKKKWYQW